MFLDFFDTKIEAVIRTFTVVGDHTQVSETLVPDIKLEIFQKVEVNDVKKIFQS